MKTPQGQSPVYGYLRQPSMVDFTGHMAAVFFVGGCNFQCRFCHNAALMARPSSTLSWAKLEDVCRGFAEHWVDAAVITGGEPTLHPDLPRLVEFFRQFGWAVKLDSNGSRPDVLESCIPLVDYVAMDVKAGHSGYAELTGFSGTHDIQASIDLIKERAADYEFRTTVIEPFHDDGQMEEVMRMIAGARRYILQPFVPRDSLPDPALAATPRTPPARMQDLHARMRETAEEVVLRGA
jgi:pyruvate formate lyase activating enzyme